MYFLVVFKGQKNPPRHATNTKKSLQPFGSSHSHTAATPIDNYTQSNIILVSKLTTKNSIITFSWMDFLLLKLLREKICTKFPVPSIE